jgi:hypothetical protein
MDVVARVKGADPEQFVILSNTPRGEATKGFVLATLGPFSEAELREHLADVGMASDAIAAEIAAARHRPAV